MLLFCTKTWLPTLPTAMNYHRNSTNRLPRAHDHICAGLKVQVPKAKWERAGPPKYHNRIFVFQDRKLLILSPASAGL